MDIICHPSDAGGLHFASAVNIIANKK